MCVRGAHAWQAAEQRQGHSLSQRQGGDTVRVRVRGRASGLELGLGVGPQGWS